MESARASQIAGMIEQKKNAAGSSELWIYQWIVKAEQLKGDGLPLPMPHKFQYFAPITQLFPLTSPPAQLYRYVLFICLQKAALMMMIIYNKKVQPQLHCCFFFCLFVFL